MTTNLKQSFIKVGYVKKAHGIKGEILIQLDSVDWPCKTSLIYLAKRNTNLESAKSFSISHARFVQKGLLVQLENCTDRDFAESLKGHEVYLQKEQFQSQKGDFLYLSELLSFSIYQKTKVDQKYIGVIESFVSYSKQDALIIKDENHKIIQIPFVSEYIDQILFDQKIIFVTLPPGFLELNH